MGSGMSADSILKEGKRVVQVEINCLQDLQARLDDRFIAAVEMILSCKGKLITTGMGKSGQIARKIASTFSSTGTPSLFLHPAESSHGDLGVISGADLVLAMSNGGESAEMVPIYEYCARKNVAIISITGKSDSSLAHASKVVLDSSVKEEACPLGLAPTSSTTVTLAIGDALAMAVLKEKGLGKTEYAEFHPGGKLGRRLLLKVKDLMHKGDSLPIVKPEDAVKEVLVLMTSYAVRGVAGVVNANHQLVGSITDGDIRRKIQKDQFSLNAHAKDLMSSNPKTIDADELAEKALFLMEQFKIDRLFVVEKESKHPQSPVGLIHIQDLLKANIR